MNILEKRLTALERRLKPKTYDADAELSYYIKKALKQLVRPNTTTYMVEALREATPKLYSLFVKWVGKYQEHSLVLRDFYLKECKQ